MSDDQEHGNSMPRTLVRKIFFIALAPMIGGLMVVTVVVWIILYQDVRKNKLPLVPDIAINIPSTPSESRRLITTILQRYCQETPPVYLYGAYPDAGRYFIGIPGNLEGNVDRINRDWPQLRAKVNLGRKGLNVDDDVSRKGRLISIYPRGTAPRTTIDPVVLEIVERYRGWVVQCGETSYRIKVPANSVEELDNLVEKINQEFPTVDAGVPPIEFTSPG